MGKVEIDVRVNKMAAQGRATIASTATALSSLFGSPDLSAGLTTVILHNLSSADNIYFGPDNTVTVANAGGVIRAGTSREIPIKDINEAPYFIASTATPISSEFWR